MVSNLIKSIRDGVIIGIIITLIADIFFYFIFVKSGKTPTASTIAPGYLHRGIVLSIAIFLGSSWIGFAIKFFSKKLKNKFIVSFIAGFIGGIIFSFIASSSDIITALAPKSSGESIKIGSILLGILGWAIIVTVFIAAAYDKILALLKSIDNFFDLHPI